MNGDQHQSQIGFTPDRRTGDMMILEKLGHIEKELAVNTTETKNVGQLLDKLNESVARHEETLGQHKLDLSQIFSQFGTVLNRLSELEAHKKAQEMAKLADATEETRSLRGKQSYWLEKLWPLVPVILYEVLRRTNVINF